MTPANFKSFLYLEEMSFSFAGGSNSRRLYHTYVVSKNEPIDFKISVSLLEVSSNPGVSKRTTFRPSKWNGGATWISLVHDCKPAPTPKSLPLAKLINYRQRSSATQHARHKKTHSRLSAPRWAHYAVKTVSAERKQISHFRPTQSLLSPGLTRCPATNWDSGNQSRRLVVVPWSSKLFSRVKERTQVKT